MVKRFDNRQLLLVRDNKETIAYIGFDQDFKSPFTPAFCLQKVSQISFTACKKSMKIMVSPCCFSSASDVVLHEFVRLF